MTIPTTPQDDDKSEQSQKSATEDVIEEKEDLGQTEEQVPEQAPEVTSEQKQEAQQQLPSPFYCPITKKVLEDPVVGPSGETYERSAILSRGDVPADKLYPNRALQSILREDEEQDTLRAGWKRLEKSVKQSLSTESAIRPLHDAYYCPITMDIMHEPVIDSEGNTFEKVAVENWIHKHRNSPITRNNLEVGDLYPNKAIEDLLKEELSKLDEEDHPWIVHWRHEDLEAGVEAARPIVPANGRRQPSGSSSRVGRWEEARRETLRRRRNTRLFLIFLITLCFLLLNLVEGGQLPFFAMMFLCLYCMYCARGSQPPRAL